MKEKLLSFFKNRTYLLIAAAVVLVVVVVVHLCLPLRTNHDISVPSPADSSAALNGNIRRADVTKSTVQAVLQTLSRTESYSRVYKVTTLWSGGQSESVVSVWKSGDKTRVNTSIGSGSKKNVLLSGKQLCIWYDGSNSVYRADLSDAAGRQELDEFSRLLTYEGILDVPSDNILDAAYLDHDGQNCIYAKYKSADGNYVNQIYVSISSGLLISAEIDQNETPVYEMESVSTDLSVPSDSSFAVPG